MTSLRPGDDNERVCRPCFAGDKKQEKNNAGTLSSETEQNICKILKNRTKTVVGVTLTKYTGLSLCPT